MGLILEMKTQFQERLYSSGTYQDQYELVVLYHS